MRGRPFKKGHTPWHAGKNYSGMSGKKHSEETRLLMSIKQRGKNNHWWNGGKCIRNGYIYISRKDHPNCNAEGYVAKHRLVMEKSIGRYLNRDEIVHHINENKLDNRLSNLIIVTKKQHMQIHRNKITIALKRRINEKTRKCTK